MARESVKRWQAGDSRFILPVQRKILLIREMIETFANKENQRAVLTLLQGATDAEFRSILSTIGEQVIRAEMDGKELMLFQSVVKTRQSATSGGGAKQPHAETFATESVLEVQKRFISNAESTNRLNCIETVRKLAPQLFAADPKLAQSVRVTLYQLTGKDVTITKAGRALANIGAASRRVRIEFNPDNGQSEPTDMRASPWDTIMGLVGEKQGWHIFAMAMFNGYHSVTVLVDNRPDGPRVYWADQWRINPGEDFHQESGSVSGFRRYEKNDFERFIREMTKKWWNKVLSEDHKRWEATLHIWKFRSRVLGATPRR